MKDFQIFKYFTFLYKIIVNTDDQMVHLNDDHSNVIYYQ